MKILGIDPGPTETAYAVWDGARVLAFGKQANDAFDVEFFRAQAGAAVALEMIASYGMAVGAEVFETCCWIGRFMERAAQVALPTRRVFRLAVKMHLCHSSRAKDANIRQALIDRLGPPGTKKAPGPTYGLSGDCWAALAVAITAFDTSDVASAAGAAA